MGRDLLLNHIGKAIGNGTETKVWSDPWISTTSQIIPFGPLKDDLGDLYVSDLIPRGSCEWNKELISTLKHIPQDQAML